MFSFSNWPTFAFVCTNSLITALFRCCDSRHCCCKSKTMRLSDCIACTWRSTMSTRLSICGDAVGGGDVKADFGRKRDRKSENESACAVVMITLKQSRNTCKKCIVFQLSCWRRRHQEERLWKKIHVSLYLTFAETWTLTLFSWHQILKDITCSSKIGGL